MHQERNPGSLTKLIGTFPRLYCTIYIYTTSGIVYIH